MKPSRDVGVVAGFRGLRWGGGLAVAAAVLAATAVAGAIGQAHLKAAVEHETLEDARALALALRRTIGEDMLRGHPAAAQHVAQVARTPGVLEVVLANADGAVVASQRAGAAAAAVDPAPYLRADRTWGVDQLDTGGRRILRLAHQVENSPVCHSCHPANRAILGTIGVGLATDTGEAILRRHRATLLLLCVALSALAGLAAAVSARRVLGPIERLSSRIAEERARAAGSTRGPEAGTAAAGGGGDEFDRLHRHFEEMVADLRSLHEREIAGERAALAHQRDEHSRAELDAVHEQLNRRIRELDDANAEINRLALQLESKNLSLERALKNLTALNRVGVALSSELDLDRLVNLVVNISVKGLRVESGFLALLDPARGELVVRGAAGLPGRFDTAEPLGAGECVSVIVAQTGRPLLIPRVDGSHGVRPDSLHGFVRRSVLCVPIRIKDRLLGAIELVNKRGDESFSGDDMEMLQSIANQAAIAIENANLYQEVQRSYFETVRALVQAVEEKDEYTRGHSERVTTFSIKTAHRMGLPPHQLGMIRYAGVLHDIGKLGIDRAIIQKPGLLTEEEHAIIRQHPIIGERILRPISFLSGALPGVSQHHERYDGKGYPHGIPGERMALEARILGVADAYDAMITARPYRLPLPRREAVQELQRCSGTQFDPIVVECFLELLETDEEIRELEEQLSAVGT